MCSFENRNNKLAHIRFTLNDALISTFSRLFLSPRRVAPVLEHTHVCADAPAKHEGPSHYSRFQCVLSSIIIRFLKDQRLHPWIPSPRILTAAPLLFVEPFPSSSKASNLLPSCFLIENTTLFLFLLVPDGLTHSTACEFVRKFEKWLYDQVRHWYWVPRKDATISITAPPSDRIIDQTKWVAVSHRQGWTVKRSSSRESQRTNEA